MSAARSTQHQYHFEDLSPDDFERLVYYLAKRSGEFDEVQGYGGMGDKGRDVIAYKHIVGGREKWYIQCKRYDTISFYHLKRELEKLAEHTEAEPAFGPDVIVFATACTPSPQAKDDATELARELGMPEPYFWARMELDERLKTQPETEEEFFGAIDGIPIPSPHQIPDPPAIFEGREHELEDLTAAVRKRGITVVGVHGTAGSGKTALALKLAQRLARKYRKAQLFIDLKGTSQSPLSPADAMRHVIHAFYGLRALPGSESELTGLYQSVLRGKKALLLLDDAAGEDQVKPLIPPESCALLLTSRNRFRIPGMHALDLDVLSREEARQLLCAIAPRASSKADDIAELCGYLPLALELAASALAKRVDLTPDEYARRLRHKSLELMEEQPWLSLSYESLDAEIQRLWCMLSVFPGALDKSVVGIAWGLEAEITEDILSDLFDYSLLQWDSVAGYHWHELVRLFASQRLSESAETELKTNVINALQDKGRTRRERRAAALLLMQLYQSDRLSIDDMPVNEMVTYLELVARYVYSPTDRRYVVRTISSLLAPSLVNLSNRQRARLFTYRAAVLADQGASDAAARDYQEARQLLDTVIESGSRTQEEEKLLAQIALGAGTLVSEEAEALDESEDRQRELLRRAVSLYREAASSAEAYGRDPILEMGIHRELSRAYAILQMWPEAELHCGRAKRAIQRMQEPESYAREYAIVLETASLVHWLHGQSLASQSDSSQAFVAYRDTLYLVQNEIAILRGLSDTSGWLVGLYVNAGDCLLKMSEHSDHHRSRFLDEACKDWKIALKVAQRLGISGDEQDAQERIDQHCPNRGIRSLRSLIHSVLSEVLRSVSAWWQRLVDPS